MKTFVQLRQQLDEVNFKQDMKKNHISSTKIKNTDVMYHSEKPGSKKFVYSLNLSQLKNSKNLVYSKI